jgi:lipoate-protein ligase A
MPTGETLGISTGSNQPNPVRQRSPSAGPAANDSADAPPPATWLEAEPGDVAGQLALDEALLEEAHEGVRTDTVVRTWMAAGHAVVLGSSSRAADELDLEACAAHGVRVLRRPSGGLSVVLGPGCLMWSVVTHHPAGPPAIDALHAAMLDPLAAALRAAGRDVVRRGSSDLAIGTGADALKVSGNALRVRRHGVLYHGTLLDAFDLDLIARVLRHPPREPDYRAGRAHTAFVTNLGLGTARLTSAVRAAFGASRTETAWPRDRVARLVGERYGDRSWTHRLP